MGIALQGQLNCLSWKAAVPHEETSRNSLWKNVDHSDVKAFIGGWRERAAGFILMTALVPLALAGYLVISWVGLFGRTERARSGVRALDHFVNASLLNGYAWESISSHAWRERHRSWARFVIWITDLFYKGHCQKANKREQRIVDLILEKGLHKQTIF